MEYVILGHTLPLWQCFIAFGLLLVVLEIFVSGFIILPVGLGFILAGFFSPLFDSWTGQLISLAANIIVIVLLFELIIKPKLQTKKVATNADSMLGKEVTVTEAIDPRTEQGYVKLYGDQWKALSVDQTRLEVGQKARIEKVDGNKVIVKAIL